MRSIRKQGGWLAHRGAGRRVITLTISSDQSSQYNIRTAAGSPALACIVIVTVQSGVVLKAGLTTGSGWKSGTYIKLVNHGTIAGTGGAGGPGANATASSTGFAVSGLAGGDAITMLFDLSADNTDGFIFGGGGGGGGGGAGSNGTDGGGGGGGGGGQGYNNAIAGSGGTGTNPLSGGHDGGAGSNGTNGSSSGAGSGGSGGGFGSAAGGDGGNGSAWATDGHRGQDGATSFGASGGAAGLAVKKNSHTLTQIAGFDGPSGTRVKGAIS